MQIKESLYTKKVGDEVKYRLLDEIANTCIQTGPLFLEYKPLLQENQVYLYISLCYFELLKKKVNYFRLIPNPCAHTKLIFTESFRSNEYFLGNYYFTPEYNYNQWIDCDNDNLLTGEERYRWDIM